MKLLHIFFLFILSCSHVFAADTDPLNRFLDKLDTLQSNFVQTLLDENGSELETTVGTLYLKQPGQFHWAYREPYVQKIISDGEVLWIYDEDLEQVTIRAMGDTLEQTPASIILGESDLSKHFVKVSLGNIEGYDWIELTPRDLEAEYNNIRIGFDDNKLGMMIIDDNLGQTTRIDFTEVSKNKTLDDELFTLVVPDYVDVIDDRENDAVLME